VVGGVIGLALALRLLAPAGMDATIFLALGQDAPEPTAYAERLLGEVAVRSDAGHDGKYFFILANDPFHLDPRANAAFLDLPTYRAQRMLFPAIAGLGGLLPPGAIVWSLLITNILALGVGAWLAALLATRWGGSSWIGLSVPLNVGLVFELLIDGAGIVAFVLCIAAVSALVRERVALASVLFTTGVLTREVMLAFVVGVVVLWWVDRRRLPWAVMVAPVLGLALWDLFLFWRLRGVTGTGSDLTFLAVPFSGLIRAVPEWIRSPGELALSVLLVLIAVGFVPVALRTRNPLAWGALAFVPLAAVLSADVYLEAADLSRALAPVFTAAAFVLFVPRGTAARPVEVETPR
jgi:hypothetical protein